MGMSMYDEMLEDIAYSVYIHIGWSNYRKLSEEDKQSETLVCNLDYTIKNFFVFENMEEEE